MSESEAILLRLSRLELDMEKHSSRDEKLFKYSHNMLEDLGTKLVAIERTGARFESDLANRALNDKNARDWLTGLDTRLQTIERLVWIAVGGVVVIGGLTSFVGGSILKLLSHP